MNIWVFSWLIFLIVGGMGAARAGKDTSGWTFLLAFTIIIGMLSTLK